MTLQQLAYFLSALDAGSFSAAAERRRLAQPSVSEQIRRLEDELGVDLFRRVGRGVIPTEAALALRPHAEAALAAVEEAREAVSAQRELRGGTVTFGSFAVARWYPGTEIVTEFRRRHPHVGVRLLSRNSSEVVEAVRDGGLEAGLIALPIDDRGLEVRPIMRDEIVYASADPARLRRPRTIGDLEAAPLVLWEASSGIEDPTRRQFAALAQRAGFSLRADIDVEDVEMAVELAGRGLGDTLLARGVLLALGDRVPQALGWVPFAEPVYDTFAFVARRGGRLSPAVREFMAVAEERMRAVAAAVEAEPGRGRRPVA